MGELELTHSKFGGGKSSPRERLTRQARDRIHKMESRRLWPQNDQEKQTWSLLNHRNMIERLKESDKEAVISSVQHEMRAPLRAHFKISLRLNLEGNFASNACWRRTSLDNGNMLNHRNQTKRRVSKILQSLPLGGYFTSPPLLHHRQAHSGASGTTEASNSYPSSSYTTSSPHPSSVIRRPSRPAWTNSSSWILGYAIKTTGHSALMSTYVLHRRTLTCLKPGNMETLWIVYYKQQESSKITSQRPEGPAFEIVRKVFHHDVVSSQFKNRIVPQTSSPINVDDAISARTIPGLVNLVDERRYYTESAWSNWCLISSGLKRNASMTLQLCMVSLTGGFKDNDSTLTDSLLKETESCKDSYAILSVVRKSKSFNVTLNHSIRYRRQKDSNYRCQPMDQKLGYQTRGRRLPVGIESYQTQLNLTKPRWEATGFEIKHDYTSSLTLTKGSDGTLQQIDEALDYRVKEFQINKTNPGLEHRFLTKKDVDRSKDFMFVILLTDELADHRIIANDGRWRAPRSMKSLSVATASVQNDNGSLEAESIVRAASTSVRFRLSTTPFCSGVRGVEV
ncbi:hypothetical protein Tco_0739700 [Tanacetum coccineum]